ncbi:MAG: peptidoglycan-associated lipoprotein Pal [bacterium]|nr:peptidoglycan-associated lipoprotein Pal [bacterium]
MFRRGFLVFPLALLMVFALAACSGSKDETTTDPEVTPTTTIEEPDDMVDDEMSAGDSDVEDVKMPVVGDVFFEYDKYALSADSRRSLENNARQLRDASSFDIVIEGHCDERGTNAYNLALGERRAKATKDYLVSLGVSSRRVTTVSYGEERPFDEGDNERAWAKNRRAHFVVQK